MTANEAKALTPTKIDALLLEEDLALAVKANAAVLSCLQEQIHHVEKAVLAKVPYECPPRPCLCGNRLLGSARRCMSLYCRLCVELSRFLRLLPQRYS